LRPERRVYGAEAAKHNASLYLHRTRPEDLWAKRNNPGADSSVRTADDGAGGAATD
jgi:hypothetical protein